MLHSVCLCQSHMIMMLISLGRQAGRQAGSRTLGQQQDGSRNRLIEVAKVTAP